MKNRLLIFFLLLFLLFSFRSYSQKKNSIKIYTQGLDFPSQDVWLPNVSNNGIRDLNINTRIGISYDRKLKSNFGFGSNYTFWIGKKEGIQCCSRLTFISNTLWGDTASVGKIFEGRNYKNFDVYGIYNLKFKENMELGFKAGPSVTWGENLYLTGIINYEWDAKYFTETKKENYYGAITGISFDYLLWQNRIPIGLDLNARYYHNFPFQLNYGFHAGFNF